MEASDYDLDLAASLVLGRQMTMLAEKDTREFVLNLLVEELRQQTASPLVRETDFGNALQITGNPSFFQASTPPSRAFMLG